MSKKNNLEYHSSQELPFISHLKKLEGSITDSHSAIGYDNWEDLKVCINILKKDELSDELIIRFTKLGAFLQNTGVIIAPFYDALLSLNQEQLFKALKEISSFKKELSENARKYLFEQISTGTPASKFDTPQILEIVSALSMPNSETWAKEATELVPHLSNLKDEDSQDYSITWYRSTKSEAVLLFLFIKEIHIKNLPDVYTQAKLIEIKNVKEASNFLSELLQSKNKKLPELFIKKLIEIILSPESESFGITTEEDVSYQNEFSKIDFMKNIKDVIVSSPSIDGISKIWIQISQSLQKFEKESQIMFLECLFDIKEILEPIFKPVILEINKLINSKDPLTQLEMFDKLKQTKTSKIIFSQALKLSETHNIHYHLDMKAEKWFIEQIHEGTIPENFKVALYKENLSTVQRLFFRVYTFSALLNSQKVSPKDFLPIIFSTITRTPVFETAFLISVFHNSKCSFDYNYLGMVMEVLLKLHPSYFSRVFERNIRYIDKAKIFYSHESGAISDELYKTIINQLGGKDKFFDPSLKSVISEDIDPIVKKLFDKTVYSKDIEDRLHGIALTLDSLIKTDTSGLMRTILEAADLPGQFLMQNGLHSNNPDTWFVGQYFPATEDITIYSMEHRSDIEVAGTIIHELTHKLLTFIFRNSSNPYYYGDGLSLEKSSSLAQILKEFESFSQDHSLFSSYNKDKWSIEVISYLFYDLAIQILTEEASDSVLVLSEKLKNWVESYLKPSLQDFDSAYEVLGSKILDEYSSQQVIFKCWSQERINKELEKISNIQKIADTESPDSFDITGTILGYLEQSEETTLEVAGES